MPSNHETVKIITWNVWFADVEYHQRMNYILNLSLSYSPDIICFQEVLLDFNEIIHHNRLINADYHISPFNSETYGVIALVKKELNPQFTLIPLPTAMDRELLRITLTKDSKRIVVGNIHLESLSSHHIRAQQLSVISQELNLSADLFLLVGDFNFCSERNFQNDRNRPLENNILFSILPQYQDLWKLYSSSVKSESLGFTFDSQANPMIIHEEQMRYDRIMANLGYKYELKDIVMIGTQPIFADKTIYVKSNPISGLWPSDHFGLMATLQLVNTPVAPYSDGAFDNKYNEFLLAFVFIFGIAIFFIRFRYKGRRK